MKSELAVPDPRHSPPTVSVVIPTFNRAHVFGEAVESVLAQTFTDFELIVVDDGSVDDTRERIAALNDPRIRYIRQNNTGAAWARNRGAVEAHGTMLSFLDSDDLWKPEKLAREVSFLNNHPEVHAVFSDLEERFLDGTTVPSFARQSPCLGKWIGNRSFPDGVVVPQREAYLILLKEIPLKPTAFTIRKDVFDQLGGGYGKEWEPSEDWEFFLRFAKKYVFGYLDHPLAVLRISSDSLHLVRLAGAPSLNLLLAEKRRIPAHDREARREVRRGISWQSRMLAWQHERRGERGLAIRAFLFGFAHSGDPGLLMRAALRCLPAELGRIGKRIKRPAKKSVTLAAVNGARNSSQDRHLRILTPYRKSNHPAWLEHVEILDELADEVAQNWRKRLPTTYRIRRTVFWALRLLRLSKNYDVILTGSDLVGLSFGVAQRIFRHRRVAHIYLDFLIYIKGGKVERALRKLFYRLAVQGASCALVQRTCEIEAYSQALGLPPSKFCLVPYHATTFDARIHNRDDGYLFAGGDSDRDYSLLVEAVRGLPSRVRIATLQRDHFANLRLPENVEIVTLNGAQFLNEMSCASVIVVPLKRLPLHVGGEQTYLNAMAMGKPTIVTDLGACDYIIDGVSGILTPPGDAAALRAAITKCLRDESFAHILGQNAKEASANFRPEKFFAAVFELCDRFADPARSA